MKQSSKQQREELTSVLRLLTECHNHVFEIAECDRMSKTGLDEELNNIGDRLCEEIVDIGEIIGRLLACDIMDGVEELS